MDKKSAVSCRRFSVLFCSRLIFLSLPNQTAQCYLVENFLCFQKTFKSKLCVVSLTAYPELCLKEENANEEKVYLCDLNLGKFEAFTNLLLTAHKCC